MPVPPRKPTARIPGSQVAPGQRPFVAPGRTTASTHQTKPTHELTEGSLYRVRDKDEGDGNPRIWAENQSYEEATRIKEKIAAERRSKTVRIVDQAHDNYGCSQLEVDGAELDDGTLPDQLEPIPAIVARAPAPRPIPQAPRPAPAPPVASVAGSAQVKQRTAEFVKSALPHDNLLETNRARALHASKVAAAAAADRHRKLAATRPPVRLEPLPEVPPSPLSDEVMEGLPQAEISDEELLADPDILDIVGEVGGKETGNDLARAKKQRDEELARGGKTAASE